MTNREIIKYLATSNPARLAEFLDDVWCMAWNRGASVQHLLHMGDESGADKMIDSDVEFSESKWLEQEANTDFFFDHELEEWSKSINNPSIEITYPDNLVIELPWAGKNPNHMWNTDNNYNVINNAIDEIKLLENVIDSEKIPKSVYDNFRNNACAYCSDQQKCLRSKMDIAECLKDENWEDWV